MGTDDRFGKAMGEARPTSPDLARRLRLRQVLRGVLGVERPPPKLDRYALERMVGTGGMGVVYRGFDVSSGRPVAVKLLSPEARVDRARFAREARLLQELSIPGVVGYVDHGTTPDGSDYLVMDWVEGEDLAQRLRRGPLEVRAALRLGLTLAVALGAVHAQGIVHRDVKPSNVILEPADRARLIDFGVARFQHGDAKLTATGAVVGTPQYMAPEQLRGIADARTDVYGLGATLFEALTGRPVFVGEHPGALMIAVLAEAPASLAAIRPEIPGALDAVIGKMLAKNPVERPVDMSAVATELAQIDADLDEDAQARVVLSRAERIPTGERVVPHGVSGLFGRERLLGRVEGILAEVAFEGIAELVTIHGEAGLGKSRVLEAIAERARDGAGAAGGRWACFRARAHRDQIGVPFSTLRALVASDSDGELLELLEHDRGSAGKRFDSIDPVLWGDRIVLAWLDRVETWTRRSPVLLAIDDLDLADASSLRLIDRAMLHLRERAFVVLGTQSSTAPVALGGRLSPDRVTRIALGPMGPQAALAMARERSEHAETAVLERAVRVSAGNPAHLLELLRATVDDGDDARSVAELVWSRLAKLAPEVRRALRAASIVGRECWTSAIAGLLGVSPDEPTFVRSLDLLVADGHLRAVPTRVPGQSQLEFVSELGYLAAYELSSEADRKRGHLAVARWIESNAPADTAGRAHHLEGAGLAGEAALSYLHAARGALAGGDRASFDRFIERANLDEAPADVVGQARALMATERFWRGDLRASVEASAEALKHLSQGSSAWYDAASVAITALGQLGEHQALRERLAEVVASEPSSKDAEVRRYITSCRALSQFLGGDEPSLRAIVEAPELATLPPEARAWRLRVESVPRMAAGFDLAIDTIVGAHQAHVEHGDLRSGALMAIYLCSYYLFSGGWERAREVIGDALRIARRLGVDYLELWGSYAEAKLFVETEPMDRALAALERIIEGASGSPRIRAGARIYASLAALFGGRPELALQYAQAAKEHPASLTRSAAASVEVLALIELERTSEAIEVGRTLQVSEAWLPEFDELLRVAVDEVARLSPDIAPAGAAESIRRRAETLADPLRRNEYLGRPRLVVRALSDRSARSHA